MCWCVLDLSGAVCTTLTCACASAACCTYATQVDVASFLPLAALAAHLPGCCRETSQTCHTTVPGFACQHNVCHGTARQFVRAVVRGFGPAAAACSSCLPLHTAARLPSRPRSPWPSPAMLSQHMPWPCMSLQDVRAASALRGSTLQE